MYERIIDNRRHKHETEIYNKIIINIYGIMKWNE
jgi:hypothetical protein